MRLIDADAMLERNENSIYDTTDLKEMLKYEPTAFNMDDVMRRLEDRQMKTIELAEKSDYFAGQLSLLNMIIPLLKGAIKN